MNRSTMRGVLRRRLMEAAPGENWVDGDLDQALNDALVDAQKDVMEIDPMAFVHIVQQNIVAGQEFYSKPSGIWYELQVQKLSPTTARYDDLERRDYYQSRLKTDVGDTSFTYANLGRHFALHPIPVASQTNGLQTIFVPTLSMSDDADVPEIHLGLHMMIVLLAHLILIGETGESAAETLDRVLQYRASIPKFYRPSGANDRFRPDLVKDYFNL